MNGVALVAFGGALGAVLRHLAGLVCVRAFGTGFPWGTLAVNVLGSFLMGALAVWLTRRGSGPDALRLALATGLLGGFTTFSTFSLDAVSLWQRGDAGAAVAYVAVSVAAGIGGLLAGLAVGRAAF